MIDTNHTQCYPHLSPPTLRDETITLCTGTRVLKHLIPRSSTDIELSSSFPADPPFHLTKTVTTTRKLKEDNSYIAGILELALSFPVGEEQRSKPEWNRGVLIFPRQA